MADDRYTADDFAADLNAVRSAQTEAKDATERANVRGGHLSVAARLHRAFVEGREFWVDRSKPQRRER